MNDKTASAKSDQILDVAEELFALYGYDGVTMRQIASQADVDVALASYYFGKKLDLFYTVFNRRAEVLSKWRRAALIEKQAKADGKPQTLEEIIEAFLLPLKIAQESGESGWRNYLALLAYVLTSPVWNKILMPSVFDKRVAEFLDALRAIFPEAEEHKLHWCYQYMSGSMALIMAQTGRIDRISDGLCQASDFDAAYRHMVPFLAAGFRTVCGPESR